MSYIKRWIEDECERIANDTGYDWEEVMDAAIGAEFDMELVDHLAHTNNLYSVIWGRKND